MHPSIIYNKRNVLFQRNTKKIIISEDIDKWWKIIFRAQNLTFLKLDSQNWSVFEQK